MQNKLNIGTRVFIPKQKLWGWVKKVKNDVSIIKTDPNNKLVSISINDIVPIASIIVKKIAQEIINQTIKQERNHEKC